MAMEFELRSRVQRIGGNGCGYRDILIHEMTEHEIGWLKSQRWMAAAFGFVVGMVCISGGWVWQLHSVVAEYCTK